MCDNAVGWVNSKTSQNALQEGFYVLSLMMGFGCSIINHNEDEKACKNRVITTKKYCAECFILFFKSYIMSKVKIYNYNNTPGGQKCSDSDSKSYKRNSKDNLA